MNDERKKDYYADILTNQHYAASIRLYNLGKYMKQHYIEYFYKIYNEKKHIIKHRTFQNTIMLFIPEVVICFITFHIGYKIIHNQLSIGDFALYTGILSQLWGGLGRAIENGMAIYDNKLHIDNFILFEQTPIKISSKGNIKIEKIYSVEFDNVSFRYPNTEKYVLENITFSLKGNEKLGIVGVNGSGKSTLLKLLLRFYDPTDGVILINGIDIRQLDVVAWRNLVSAYIQNAPNFSLSLRTNIALSDKENSHIDKKIHTALEDAEIWNMSLPKGLNTCLSRLFDDEGIEMSVGQEQKIALARTFYKMGELVLLDEPSSSLDPESEAKIMKKIKEKFKNCMLIATSHRLMNLSIVDKILVLENGRLIESGTKEELLNLNKRFSELYACQMDKF
ncbi:MAG: ABC transporter ATP-binding protein/permease [Clostridium sp.]|nr:ABC transporter ATP-binding protein/permease [Clostridium sp.]